MSLVAIIIIAVVVAVAVVALVALMPRLRERSRIRARERELGTRRESAVAEHQEVAESRNRRAEEAEQRARIAEQEARRERAEADLHHEKARVHEAGLADHELIEPEERDRFAGTSAVDERADATDQESRQVPGETIGRREGALREFGRIKQRCRWPPVPVIRGASGNAGGFYGLPEETSIATLVPAGLVAPAPGVVEITSPPGTVFEAATLTRPARQCTSGSTALATLSGAP